jgi:hypothetical protein
MAELLQNRKNNVTIRLNYLICQQSKDEQLMTDEIG